MGTNHRGSSQLDRDGAGQYVIHVQGEVSRHWEPELRLAVTYEQTELGTVSTLSGHLPDQAALLGALGWLAMWGYLILDVSYSGGLANRDG